MPNNPGKKAALREARAKAIQQERTIQAVGLAVIAVIIIAVGWILFPKQKSAAGSKQYDAPPSMMIDVNKQYFAAVKMAKGGEFVIELYADKAPITVNSFVFLAREGYFDGVTFHRVLEGFMAQGGDPTGSGAGGPGYEFQDEFSDLTFDEAGILAMANSGPNTNGSQFFITYAPTPWLDGLHTIFGKVIEGMDVVNGITRRDPSTATTPGDAIESITITEE